MNVEIGAEAAQFPEKEYINGIAVAVLAEPIPCNRFLGSSNVYKFELCCILCVWKSEETQLWLQLTRYPPVREIGDHL
jgi:hypothetical protein